MATVNYLSIKSIFQSLSSLHTWHALRTHALTQLGWLQSRKNRKSIDNFGPIPWWTYSCSHYLDQIVSPDASVLEFGGGSSTLWWLNRGNKVVTFETEPTWTEILKKQVSEASLEKNWELVAAKRITLSDITSNLNSRTFDVVINDGLGDRSEIVEILKLLRKSNGFIIWDNSDRSEYANGLKMLENHGLKRLDFFGLSPINAYCSQTTLFNSDFPQPLNRMPKFEIIPN